MINSSKKTILVMPFGACQYSSSEVEYLLPGIISKHFLGDKELFEQGVKECVGFYNDDKGGFFEKLAYYENMCDIVGAYLEHSGEVGTIRELLETHFVTDAQIMQHTLDLVLQWEPKR